MAEKPEQTDQSQFCGLYKSLVMLATYALTEGKTSVVVLLLSVFLICNYSGDCIAQLECGLGSEVADKRIVFDPGRSGLFFYLQIAQSHLGPTQSSVQ
jgi:hypothetical protein